MAGKHDDAGVDALTKYVRQQVADMKIDKGLKNLLLFILDNSAAFIDFARSYAKMKATGKVEPDKLMMDFLKARGRTLAEFGIAVIDVEMLSDAWALVNLLMNIKSSLKYSSGGPIGIAMTVGFVINDAADFLANFTPAQRAYYEMFLRKSSIALMTTESQIVPVRPASGARTVRCY